MPAKVNEDVDDLPFGLPRLQFASADLNWVVYVQDDRTSVGWARTTPLAQDPSYPGFSAVLEKALDIFNRVAFFHNDVSSSNARPAVAEISYTDGFDRYNEDGSKRSLQDMFTCFQSQDDFTFNKFNMVFHRALRLDEANGVTGQSQTVISGFHANPTGEAVVNLHTIVRFTVGDIAETRDSYKEMQARFEAGHQVAKNIFQTLVKQDEAAIYSRP